MSKQNVITKAYTRHYRDNGQTTAYVEWSDGSRTEGRICSRRGDPKNAPAGEHMRALFAAAKRLGLTIEHQVW